MRLNRTQARQGLTALIILLLVSLFSLDAAAQSRLKEIRNKENQEAEEEANADAPLMKEEVYKRLSKAQKLAEEKEFEEALKILDKIKDMKDLSTTDLTQLWSFYAYIYHSQEKMDLALMAYENILGLDGLQEALEVNTLYTLSQLYFSKEDWKKGLEMLERWFPLAKNPGPEPYITASQANYQLGRFKEAIPYVYKALEIAKEQDKEPQENWYLLLRVFYYELEDYPNVMKILEELIQRWPRKEYWLQISAIYGELDKPKEQLNTLELIYYQGMMTEKTEYLNLAQLLLMHEVSYTAAKVLDEGLKKGIIPSEKRYWRMLAEAWTLSQEERKSVEPMKKAAELSDDGELDLILAQTFQNLEEWQKSADSARTAIKKGVDRPDTAHILLGMALFNMEQAEDASKAFQVAQKDDRSRSMASQWIRYIQTEQARKEDLRSAVEDN